MCRSEWLIECKNHLEFKAIKILLTTYLPFSWFALNLSKISRDNVKIQKGFLKKKFLISYQFIIIILPTINYNRMKQSSIWNSVGAWQTPVCWFGSFLYGSGGFIVREFEPFLDKQVGNLGGGLCGVQVKAQMSNLVLRMSSKINLSSFEGVRGLFLIMVGFNTILKKME